MSIMKKEKNKGLQVYGIYKGDKFIDVGTTKELSQKFNVTRKTVQFWSTPSYKKRVEAAGDINRLIAVKIGRDDYGEMEF